MVPLSQLTRFCDKTSNLGRAMNSKLKHRVGCVGQSREKARRSRTPCFPRTFALKWHFVLILFFGKIAATQAAISNVPNPFPVTFESFLTNPPTILVAEFEVHQSVLPEVRARHPNLPLVFTNNCTLRLDETNYMLYWPNLGTYIGKFGSVEWRREWGSPLELADQRMNARKTLSDIVGVSKWPINRILNLGIQEIVPHTLVWAEGAGSFTAQCCQDLSDESGTILGSVNVQLHYTNGLPFAATTRDSWGLETEVTYTYDPGFFGGKLPMAFDVKQLRPESGPMFGIRIRNLKLSKQHIDLTQFDPRIILKGNYRGLILFSNDLSYSVSRLGRMRPTLTAEQAQRLTTDAQAKKYTTASYIVRIALIIFIVSPLVLIFAKRFQQKTKH